MPIVKLNPALSNSLTCPLDNLRVEWCCGDIPDVYMEVHSTCHLDSERLVLLNESDRVAIARQMEIDSPIIKTLLFHFDGAPASEFDVVTHIAELKNVDVDRVRDVLERHCGETEPHHLWMYEIHEEEGRVYTLTETGWNHHWKKELDDEFFYRVHMSVAPSAQRSEAPGR